MEFPRPIDRATEGHRSPVRSRRARDGDWTAVTVGRASSTHDFSRDCSSEKRARTVLQNEVAMRFSQATSPSVESALKISTQAISHEVYLMKSTNYETPIEWNDGHTTAMASTSMTRVAPTSRSPLLMTWATIATQATQGFP